MTPTLANTPVITTDRLILRAPQKGDQDAWFDYAKSDRSRFTGGPLDDLQAWRALCHLTGHWVHRGFGMFVFHQKGDDTPLGMTGPWFPETWPEREIGWTIWNHAAEGKGFAFEAAQAARAFAFSALGWSTAVSYIHPDNARSIALAIRLGATLDPQATPMGADPCLVYRHPDAEQTNRRTA
jgi:RimJ/RimL family protein N-acetyltransferase